MKKKDRFPCAFCDNKDCEQIPYPKGLRWQCQLCGQQYLDSDAMDYKYEQSKQVAQLLEQIEKQSKEH